MPHDRFYTSQTFVNDATLTLTDDEAHHLGRVMRIRVGERIELINGSGQLGQALVEQVEKRQVLLHLQEVINTPPPQHQIILAQALPRINRLDTIVEKGTELGITHLWLFPGQRSEKDELSTNQLQRVHALTISALKQCGRLYLPKIELKPPLAKWDFLPCPSFFGDLNEGAPPFLKAWSAAPDKDILFVVGPESGLTPEEIKRLKTLGATGVRLHQNILRTDTAPLVALSLIAHQQLCGLCENN